MPPPTTHFDVAIIGAGVVGAAIARELARYRLRCVLIEAAADVGTGTSKANTAILHTGFDAKPGTLEARLVRRGHALLSAYGPEVGIPIEPHRRAAGRLGRGAACGAASASRRTPRATATRPRVR